MTTVVAGCFPHMRVSAEVGFWTWNGRPPTWQSDWLTTRPQQLAHNVYFVVIFFYPIAYKK